MKRARKPAPADDTRLQESVSFKAGPELTRFLRNIPNRSKFIRTTLMAAFGHICPLCQGRGVLGPEEVERWQALTKSGETPSGQVPSTEDRPALRSDQRRKGAQ
jgi:hypothetical protein